MPYNKHNYNVKVPNRSGFDKSHRNSGTLTAGTLTPILCDEVIPNSRVSLKLNMAMQLPPLVSDTYMNVKLKAEAFFVPLRLLCGSFEAFFCDTPQDYMISSSGIALTNSKFVLPHLTINAAGDWAEADWDTASARDFGPGSLADYLGFGFSDSTLSDIYVTGSDPYEVNMLPFVAYHLIYQEWYRNPRVQKPAFVPWHGAIAGPTYPGVANLPTQTFVDGDVQFTYMKSALQLTNVGGFPARSLVLADGVRLFDLRQRNFPLDYFTGGRVSAQQGDPAAVTINLPDTEDTTSFTIAQLRAANSLQQFRERNGLPSPRLVDQVRARYGANLSDGVAQRPICIGTASYDVASTGVSQTAAAESGQGNPFSGVAAQYGRAYGSGSDFIISDFTANEPGYIMVLISLVPEVTYSNLLDRKFFRYVAPGSITDMANPLLQNVGDQPIYGKELTGFLGVSGSGGAAPGDSVFAYQDRYSDFMFIPNQAHGLFRDGSSLESFVLQRSAVWDYDSPLMLSSEFLEIPKNYFDQVFAASTGVSGVSAWYDSYLHYRVSMPLAEFSIPSLQDPAYEHGQSVSIRRNGQIF